MTTRLWTCWVVVMLVAVTALVPAALSYRAAAVEFNRARSGGDVGARLHAEMEAAAKSLPAWARAPQRKDDEPALAQRFAAAVTSAGLPPGAVEAFTPAPSSAIEVVPGSKTAPVIVRARAVGGVSGITLPQLGRLLGAWHTAAPGWVVTQIDITPLRLSPADAAQYAGSDLPLRVSLSVERLTATGLEAFILHPDSVPPVGPKDAPR